MANLELPYYKICDCWGIPKGSCVHFVSLFHLKVVLNPTHGAGNHQDQ